VGGEEAGEGGQVGCSHFFFCGGRVGTPGPAHVEQALSPFLFAEIGSLATFSQAGLKLEILLPLFPE
jgi:hypothetical protein